MFGPRMKSTVYCVSVRGNVCLSMLQAHRLGTQPAEHLNSQGNVHRRRKCLTERPFSKFLAVLILKEFEPILLRS